MSSCTEKEPLPDLLRSLAAKHQVPGAQLAIQLDGRTTSVAFGETEYRSGVAVTDTTAFPVGSITKAFTATVAMVLVADGDLSLDAPVSEYLPELLVERDDRRPRITLRQLLSHTSGLATGPDTPASVSMRRYVLDHCRQANQVLGPGTAFSYSNLGYVLVGHLIETVTGMTWWEAVELILLKPLGIVPSFIAAPPDHVPERAIASGHSVHPLTGRTVAVRQNETLVEAPTGSLALSAADLVSFGLMHVGRGVPEVLPARFAELMRQAVPGADPVGLADGWGLGLARFDCQGSTWVGHDGNADGTSCYLRINPSDGCVVAITTNANTGKHLWQDFRAEPREAVATPGRTALPAGDYAGTYSNGDDEYQVLAKDGPLRLALDGEVIARLVLVDDLTFALHEPGTDRQLNVGRFHRDPISGGIDGIHTLGRFARRRAPRIPRARGRATSRL
jgi:CubicO group peptidase (beta-lactamase class C family)